MANTGAVRATEARTMSGVAMQTEFQLLNAKLSEMADNLELAEEQIWQLWCMYQGQVWDGEIEYPGSFNIRNTSDEIQQLATAAGTNPVDARVRQAIDVKILDWLDLDEDELAALANPALIDLESVSERGASAAESAGEHPSLADLSQADQLAHIQGMLREGYSNQEIQALHPEVTLELIVQAAESAAREN
jgi:hypothetical protein